MHSFLLNELYPISLCSGTALSHNDAISQRQILYVFFPWICLMERGQQISNLDWRQTGEKGGGGTYLLMISGWYPRRVEVCPKKERSGGWANSINLSPYYFLTPINLSRSLSRYYLLTVSGLFCFIALKMTSYKSYCFICTVSGGWWPLMAERELYHQTHSENSENSFDL